MAADRDDGSDLPKPKPSTLERGADQPTLEQPAAGRPAPDRIGFDRSAERGPGDAPPTGDSGPELRERQLAEHARYRLVVEATTAREKWARAAPELEAEWTEHKRRYPAPDRQAASTQPDGSWHGDGGRRLSPEQNAEAGKCAADLRDEARQSIRPAMERVEAADPSRKLAGLEHMLKGEDRLKEKVADAMEAPGITVREALDLVPDAVRFTLVYPSERYAEGVLGDVERLKAEGFELIKLKNLWQAEQYKGINSQWRRPDTGLRLEMQFHTPESREAKEVTHEAYVRIRASATLTDSENQELKDFQRRVNSVLAIPPGNDKIREFPEKRDQNSG
jgi:hypothetical protein